MKISLKEHKYAHRRKIELRRSTLAGGNENSWNPFNKPRCRKLAKTSIKMGGPEGLQNRCVRRELSVS